MRIGLNKEKSVEVAKKLNKYLADLHVLYSKLHNYHWNVVGLGFFEMHLKLEELYTATATEIDTIAERILQLEERPLASMKSYLEVSTLKEAESQKIKPAEAAKDVLSDYEVVLKEIREIVLMAADNNDDQTVALIDGSIANYEKHIWMLSAYLD
ncbi:MAG: DNA starvation/stationary phase protection protein [Fusobacteriaceae bacterium]|jgi:starvation-inducible DNA-binding protein|nr:DNA starvation/stationary phase protection protein [Fusobacteriaceae bacterium]